MADMMVVERMNTVTEGRDPMKVLHEVHRRHRFISSGVLRELSREYLVVSADTGARREEVSRDDFLLNSLSPIIEKARRSLRSGFKLTKVSIENNSLVFFFDNE